MIPPANKRVTRKTKPPVNRDIRHRTLEHLEEIGKDPGKIAHRLDQLEREWDVERALEVVAGSMAILGFSLSLTVNRKWLTLPAVSAAFLVQHAIQGWCPPLSVLRRMGIRTQREIDDERSVLKARRGDYNNIATTSSAASLELAES